MNEITYVNDVGLATEDNGRVRKQILPRNKVYRWPNRPGMMLSITDEILDQIVENFKNQRIDVVPFFKVDKKNSHTEDPEAARGKIVDLIKTDEGLDAIIEPTDDAVRQAILATQLGASAGIKFDYELHDTGENVGAVLRHVAWTPEPWIPGMKPFEEVSLSGESYEAVFLSEEQHEDESNMEGGGNNMTKEEIQAIIDESVKNATAELSAELEATKVALQSSQAAVETLTAAVNQNSGAATERSVKTELDARIEAGLPPAIASLAAPILLAGDGEVHLSADETSTVSEQLRAILDLVPKVDFSEKGEAGVPDGAVVVLSAEQVKALGFETEQKQEEDPELSAEKELIQGILSHVPADKRKEA